MRTYTEDKVLINMMIFEGHVEKDKWNNEISKILFPDFTFRMVHHTEQGKFRQNATIYGGRDKFLKFSSYYSDNDLHAHSVSIRTALGEITTWWGDGDGGFLEFDEELKNALPEHTKALLEEAKGYISNSVTGGDNEIAFILYMVNLIHMAEDENLWFNKEKWGIKREELKASQGRR